MNEPRSGGALLVIGWSRMPRKAARLFEILEQTRDDELELLMRVIGGPGGHIAWAEYGRRKYGVHFGIENGVATPLSVSSLVGSMS